MAKIKIAGSWTGVLEVEIDTWTVPRLRTEIANRSNSTPEAIKLISAGRVLKDGNGNETLKDLGLKDNSKILSTRTSEPQKKDLEAAEERNARLARIKSAADALAKRHACGKMTEDDFDLELEDQKGRIVQFPEEDRKALMMCLMLHTFGKVLMRKGKYEDALEVLIMADESCSLCDKATIEMVDNVAILQIDIVWCYFMLRDIRWLATAGERLEKAWSGLAKSHGKNVERFRQLQPGSSTDVALYLKVELLEGVVAYHTNRFERSKELLTSAQSKFWKLNVSDESLSTVMNLGFGRREATRALRMNNQDVTAAVSFLIDENERNFEKDEENRRRRDELREQRKYGKTASKNGVDMKKLKDLGELGYEKDIAAEALRRRDNDFDLALDDLMNPAINTDIQVSLESRKRNREGRHVESRTAVSMGPDPAIGPSAGETMVAEGGSNEAVAMECESSTRGGQPEEIGESSNRDDDMEGRLTAEVAKTDPWSDYDIDIAVAGEAIQQYLSLVEADLTQ